MGILSRLDVGYCSVAGNSQFRFFTDLKTAKNTVSVFYRSQNCEKHAIFAVLRSEKNQNWEFRFFFFRSQHIAIGFKVRVKLSTLKAKKKKSMAPVARHTGHRARQKRFFFILYSTKRPQLPPSLINPDSRHRKHRKKRVRVRSFR